MEFKHVPIMLAECINGLNIKKNGSYVDGTMGGAGHSYEILKNLNGGTLIAIDKDHDAILAGSKKLGNLSGNAINIIHNDFKEYTDILKKLSICSVDGVLLDLGISSYQIDNPERGFSYMKNSKLDMRMDRQQTLSAYDVVNEYSKEKLIEVIFSYGEERFAKSIVRSIIEKRKIKKIETTRELSEIIVNSYPLKYRNTGSHPSKKTFQAIRIEVNSELSRLEKAVQEMINSLKQNGRIVILTFHSLEDRIIKKIFKKNTLECICPKDFPVCNCNVTPSLKLINKKPVTARAEELLQNPRSKSAKLRIAVKV